MVKTTIKLTTWSISKKKAQAKLNDRACTIFEKVVTGLLKQQVCLEEASLLPVSLKGFLLYRGVYKIVAKPQRKLICTVTKVSKVTKEQIKKTQKKIYKKQNRDSKGRFKKGK